MGRRHHPVRGSHGYSPRKRARRPFSIIKSWPELNTDKPKVQGFAGYKAGMTHALVIGQSGVAAKLETRIPVTVVEVPPMKVVAVRVYTRTYFGLKTATELWTKKLDKELRRRFPISKEYDYEGALKKLESVSVDEVRLLAHTQPKLVSGVPKKAPELMELRIGGGTIKERLEYAKALLGKEIKITDFANEGQYVDVSAITTGKGFQGHIKRWGVKLQPHKNSKHRRMIGTLGPHFPSYVLPTVPQAGQVGFHQRTEHNKRIIKIGTSGDEITPAGGFLHYGNVKNGYILIHGSVPGCAKRLVRLRDPARLPPKLQKTPLPEITYISRESKQGV